MTAHHSPGNHLVRNAAGETFRPCVCVKYNEKESISLSCIEESPRLLYNENNNRIFYMKANRVTLLAKVLNIFMQRFVVVHLTFCLRQGPLVFVIFFLVQLSCHQLKAHTCLPAVLLNKRIL